MYSEMIRIPSIVHRLKELEGSRERFVLAPTPFDGSQQLSFRKCSFCTKRHVYARDEHAVASSWCGIGVLSANEHTLFVADGVERQHRFFDLTENAISNLDHFS
jgi:hypothetical protein